MYCVQIFGTHMNFPAAENDQSKSGNANVMATETKEEKKKAPTREEDFKGFVSDLIIVNPIYQIQHPISSNISYHFQTQLGWHENMKQRWKQIRQQRKGLSTIPTQVCTITDWFEMNAMMAALFCCAAFTNDFTND